MNFQPFEFRVCDLLLEYVRSQTLSRVFVAFPWNPLIIAIKMGRRTRITVVVALLAAAAGLAVYLHRPAKPVRIHQTPPTREFVGVGLALRMDAQSPCPIIQNVVPNTPAAAAGITSGQTVAKVDGVSLEGKSLAECVNLIRGPAGTIVQLELVAPDRSRTNVIEMTRQKLKL